MQYCPKLHFQFAIQLDYQLFLFLKLIQMFQDRQKMFLGRFQYDKKLYVCYFPTRRFPIKEVRKKRYRYREYDNNDLMFNPLN